MIEFSFNIFGLCIYLVHLYLSTKSYGYLTVRTGYSIFLTINIAVHNWCDCGWVKLISFFIKISSKFKVMFLISSLNQAQTGSYIRIQVRAWKIWLGWAQHHRPADHLVSSINQTNFYSG